jgi:hypothetical protein
MATSTCRARHPITRERCALAPTHLAHVTRSGVSFPGSRRRAERDTRERVKGRRGQDAREWGWTEAQG